MRQKSIQRNKHQAYILAEKKKYIYIYQSNDSTGDLFLSSSRTVRCGLLCVPQASWSGTSVSLVILSKDDPKNKPTCNTIAVVLLNSNVPPGLPFSAIVTSALSWKQRIYIRLGKNIVSENNQIWNTAIYIKVHKVQSRSHSHRDF